MAARPRMGGSFRELVEKDLDIMPLMNLFVALIPMLLISAVFLNVTVIDMKSPQDLSDSSGDNKAEKNIHLAVTIQEDHYVVEGKKLRKRVVARVEEDADMQLAEILWKIKQDHPANEELMIISQPQTLYDEIIGVMDISREAGMPGVSLLGAPN